LAVFADLSYIFALMEEDSSDDLHGLDRLAPEEKPVKVETVPEKVPRAVSLNLMREKKPRLVIDHMVLDDFKSYAGKQVIGKFHGNFTSVVGPNGSGKSNLIESMLFIFGFNASWMRLNKLNQLIHNSSSSTGNSRAAVEVHFKKVQELATGELVEVAGSEFWIRRTVNSGSVSKYFIEGRESTQAEVKERLRA
jgi:structural maintenance of chromosome 4